MKFISTHRGVLLPLFGVMAAFIISRMLYDSAGIRFQGDLFLGWWHYIDPALMLTDLWRSIFHLHSQPPLMNLFSGIVLQAFPATYQKVFHIIYFLTGFVFLSGMYVLGIQMSFRPWLSAVLTAAFMASPATVMYEHLLAYGYPITALLVWAGVFLYHFIETGNIRWGLLFFCSGAIIALLWGLFHIAWLVVIITAL